MATGQTGKRARRNGTRLRSRAPLFARMRSGWHALLLALLVAFSWQSFVTQTHLHYEPGIAAAASAAPAAADQAVPQPPAKKSPFELPSSCPVCREIAHAGPILPPAPLELAAPVPAAVWLALTLLLGVALVQRSHAWQSRAPPYRLQA